MRKTFSGTRKNTKGLCTFDGCNSAHHANGLCTAHNNQRTSGIELRPVRKSTEEVCSEPGCKEMCVMRWFCLEHKKEAEKRARRERSAHSCAEPECDVTIYSTSLRCAPCKEVFIQRTADEKRVRKARMLEDRPECSVPTCRSQVGSKTMNPALVSSKFCRIHVSDMKRKSMTPEVYLTAKSVTECESCGISGVKLVVDHRHGHHEGRDSMCPECIRGVLCGGCNSSFGMMREDVSRIEGLLEYAKKHSPKIVDKNSESLIHSQT